MRTFLATIGLLAAIALSYPAAPEAQPPGGVRGMGPRYDPSTEATIRGTVQEVRQVPGRREVPGMHVVVKSDQESIEVHLGPSTFLAEQKLALQKGDVVEVVGSRVTIGDATAIIAREIRKGDQKVTLRDAQGIPQWSRGPKG